MSFILISSCPTFLRLWKFVFIGMSTPTSYFLEKEQAALFINTFKFFWKRITLDQDAAHGNFYSPHSIYPSFGESDQQVYLYYTISEIILK